MNNDVGRARICKHMPREDGMAGVQHDSSRDQERDESQRQYQHEEARISCDNHGFVLLLVCRRQAFCLSPAGVLPSLAKCREIWPTKADFFPPLSSIPIHTFGVFASQNSWMLGSLVRCPARSARTESRTSGSGKERTRGEGRTKLLDARLEIEAGGIFPYIRKQGGDEASQDRLRVGSSYPFPVEAEMVAAPAPQGERVHRLHSRSRAVKRLHCPRPS